MNNLIDGLKILLASNFVLYLKTHAAHWNVTGMFFYEYHKLLEKQYEDLWENVDTIAEKIRELDSFVTLTPQEQLSLSIVSSDQAIVSSKEYVLQLMQDHERMIFLLNKIFVLAESSNNQAIMNYLAERLDAHAKMRWFLKASITQYQ
jgi:starvation-inducible DNA-binding protein